MDTNPETQTQTQGTGATEPEKTFDYEAFVGGLDEATRTALTGHFDGQTKNLKSALDGERKNTAELTKQLKALEAKAEQGSELQKQLAEMQAQLKGAERDRVLLEGAYAQKALNPTAAVRLIVASGDTYFRADGSVDWDLFKKDNDYLFPKGGSTQGGAGTGTTPPGKNDINSLIRRAAGRE